MLQEKSKLITYLNDKSKMVAINNELCIKVRDYCHQKYDIPTGLTMDMITRGMLDEQTEFVLFCLTDALDEITGTRGKAHYFSDLEINQYTNMKYEIEAVNFPIRIKCHQVNPDQWIGVSDAKFFIKLRKAQLISYNINAQRVMKKIIKGENILYKLVPNKVAIKQIKKLMEQKQYIPTSLTLNIRYDSDADFYYDTNNHELVIKSIKSFDISDGYHRYLAMCFLGDEISDFNYPMEIRIVNFTEEKTRQFIFQEDQKTKMTSSASNSMNMNRYSNTVIERLNEMPTFEFKGQIGRNEGTVDYAAFSDIIEYVYFAEKKEYTNLDIRTVATDIKDKLNALVEHNPEFLTKALGRFELAVIFYCLSTEEHIENALELIEQAFVNNVHKKLKHFQKIKPLFNMIEKIIGGKLYV